MYTFLVWLTNQSAELECFYLNHRSYAFDDREGMEEEGAFQVIRLNQLRICLFLGARGRGQRGREHEHLGVHEGQVGKADDHLHGLLT